MIMIRDDLIDPHIYLDCEMSFKREIFVLHFLARNFCYLDDWLYYMETYYDQSSGVSRRKLKAMIEKKIVAINKTGKTYIYLLSNGLSYALGKKVGNPKPIQNDLQLEKANVILRNVEPTYIYVQKRSRRMERVVEKYKVDADAAGKYFEFIEQRYIYLLGFKIKKEVLSVSMLQYDPYTTLVTPFYKLNRCLDNLIDLLRLPATFPIELRLTIVAKYRVEEKRAYLEVIKDHNSNEYKELYRYCNKKNSFAYFSLGNTLIMKSNFERYGF